MNNFMPGIYELRLKSTLKDGSIEVEYFELKLMNITELKDRLNQYNSVLTDEGRKNITVNYKLISGAEE